MHSEIILSDGANRVKDTTVVQYNADLQNQNKLTLYPTFLSVCKMFNLKFFAKC